MTTANVKPCQHGWRGAPAEMIADRCPSCDMASMFIGAGGWLTCGNLDCREPGITRAYTDEIRSLLAKVASLRVRAILEDAVAKSLEESAK